MTPTEAELEVYDSQSPSATFAAVDALLKHAPVTGDSPLETWYRSVASTRIDLMKNDDLTRAVVQGQHLPLTIVEALRRLRTEPLIGTNFPGELIDAVVRAPAWFWLGYSPLIETVRLMGEAAMAQEELEAETKTNITRFISQVASEPVLKIEVEVAGGKDVHAIMPGQRFSIGSSELASVRIPKDIVALPPEALIFEALPKGVRFIATDPRAKLKSSERLLGGEQVTLGPLSVKVLPA